MDSTSSGRRRPNSAHRAEFRRPLRMTQHGIAHEDVSVASQGRQDAPFVPGDGRASRSIFYLLDSFNVGGTETQAVELALRMSARGHRVTMGCLKAEGPLIKRLLESNVAVQEFHPDGGIDSARGVYQFLRLTSHLRKGGYQIVHTHDLWSNLMGIPAARLAGVQAIVSSRRDLGHLDWYEGERRNWLRRIQNWSHVVLTNAAPIRSALISEDGFAAEKVRVVYNGINVERFRPHGERQHLSRQADGGKSIVLVGNMHSEVKGHSWLIASAPAVLAEFPLTRLVLVGDGKRRKRLEQEARALGVGENFVFLGVRDDVPEILAGCDIAVLPSLAEGLPNAVLEYMAAGLPCVVSDAGGNAELVQDGVTGLRVPPRDSGALAQALLRLLRDSDLAGRLARNAKDFVERSFSFERMVEQVEQLYGDLLDTGMRGS
jgi:glycosyltransferase involved in cell wall biosynthesis